MLRKFTLIFILLFSTEARSQQADSSRAPISPFAKRIGKETGLTKEETRELQDMIIQYSRALRACRNRHEQRDSFRVYANRLRGEFLLKVRERFGPGVLRIIIQIIYLRDPFPPVIRKEIGLRRKRLPR